MGGTASDELRPLRLLVMNAKAPSGRKWWVTLTCVVDDAVPLCIVREASWAYARDVSPALRAQFDELASFLHIPIEYRVD